MTERRLDLICLGRSSVDLYGEQVGGRLENMLSFAKYVGGCPTNIAIGAARLGLKSAALTRVGNEHMGRFIQVTLAAEGVDVSHVVTDPERLTALVILGIRDKQTFPLIFYRENCADMALSPTDFDEIFIGSSKGLLVSGTHFSTEGVSRASRAAMASAKATGARIILDIDYRPVLWGLTERGLGEERFVADDAVTRDLQSIVPDCDLIVGTEEEVHIAGGTVNTIAALRRIREISNATLVLKRGAMGCSVYSAEVPDELDDGLTVEGFPVEIFNVLGAGDAFMSGFLRGWLRDESLEVCARWANACGAFAVSRHGCAPAMPSWMEMQDFLEHGSDFVRLREDEHINHLHWVTTRHRSWSELLTFAFDDRIELEAIAARNAKGPDDIAAFKQLCWHAVTQANENDVNVGVVCDDRVGEGALHQATGSSLWIGRSIEVPGSRPLVFERGLNVAATLRSWPVEHCVKCHISYHPDDETVLRDRQEEQVETLFHACRYSGHELLLEVVSPQEMQSDSGTVPRAMERFYERGVNPDWWCLMPPESEEDWSLIANVIDRRDAYCRGVLIFGQAMSEDELGQAFATAAKQPICKGFSVGHSIFGAPAKAWFAGDVQDMETLQELATRYRNLIGLWCSRTTAAA